MSGDCSRNRSLFLMDGNNAVYMVENDKFIIEYDDKRNGCVV